MINRKEKELQKFKELINKEWKLSIAEEDFLDTILNLILTQDSKKASEFLESYLSEEWEEVLEMIPDYHVENYASYNLDMIESRDCEEKSLEDYEDGEIREEYFDRFNIAHTSNIVSDLNFEEMSELFLSFSPQKQQDIINTLRNEI